MISSGIAQLCDEVFARGVEGGVGDLLEQRVSFAIQDAMGLMEAARPIAVAQWLLPEPEQPVTWWTSFRDRSGLLPLAPLYGQSPRVHRRQHDPRGEQLLCVLPDDLLFAARWMFGPASADHTLGSPVLALDGSSCYGRSVDACMRIDDAEHVSSLRPVMESIR